MTPFKPIQFYMLNISVFLGTMGTTIVPKVDPVEKYDTQDFKRRIARLFLIIEHIFTFLQSLKILSHFKRKNGICTSDHNWEMRYNFIEMIK